MSALPLLASVSGLLPASQATNPIPRHGRSVRSAAMGIHPIAGEVTAGSSRGDVLIKSEPSAQLARQTYVVASWSPTASSDPLLLKPTAQTWPALGRD